MEAKNISYSYDDKLIINNLSVTLPEQGVTSLIGPNGSGKSTLLKIMTGQIQDYQGQVLYQNTNFLNMPIKQRSQLVSYFNQRERVYGLISVRSILDMSNQQNINYMEFVDYFGLSDKLDESFNNLSGGQQQVLLVLSVLIENTNYVFLDEPFNNLDPLYKAKLVNLIRFRKQYQSFFIVDHDIDTLAMLSDWVLLYKDGMIVNGGNTSILDNQNLEYVFNTNFQTYFDGTGNKRLVQYF
ncbi:ATP-binding cassette domain-containing protein [Companilactobacillus jidongensis]|uniref:ATP-binding cassette domain-containing protein n=1 Tax=Companilactobacillus jidongensis TaxID=2486006 RepID=UPI000F78104B|nr:ABC transporter ATP-binding protein [Companilactobacillus jidongensis]